MAGTVAVNDPAKQVWPWVAAAPRMPHIARGGPRPAVV